MIKKGQTLTVTISDLAFGGKGIAKIQLPEENNTSENSEKLFPIFIDGGLPGQEVEIKIKRKKRRHAEAKIVKIIKHSPKEVQTPYMEVPGAPWAKLPTKIQEEYKHKQVVELFDKFTNVNFEEVFDEYISSPQPWEYRNKMEYSFGPSEENFTIEMVTKTDSEGNEREFEKKIWDHTGFALGSKKRGQFWLVQSLQKPSGLFDEKFESFLPKIEALCESSKLPVYNSRTDSGFWRQITVRKSFAENTFLIDVITNIPTQEERENALDFIEKLKKLFLEKFPENMAGIYWTQSADTGNPAQKFHKRNLLMGVEKITEKLKIQEDQKALSFDISLDSFFQTNVKSAEKLYKKVLDYAHENILNSSNNIILDLFCGTGTIGQILAQNLDRTQVMGVEIIPSAVDDARKNAKKNNIKNITFKCNDVFKQLKNIPPFERRNTSTIILDPPRAGITPKTLKKLMDFEVPEIIYVSCNPSTLARDTKILEDNNYTLEKISLVDQFPHTSHVECVSRFQLKTGEMPKEIKIETAEEQEESKDA